MSFTERYPAIKAFVRGYLNQDVLASYGSTDGAAQEFCRNADHEQLAELRAEWEDFRARHVHVDDINRALSQLGSAWRFHNLEEFRSMLRSFEV